MSASNLLERNFFMTKSAQNQQQQQQQQQGKSEPGQSPRLDVNKCDALSALDDTRILVVKPLITPAILCEDVPLTPMAYRTIEESRRMAEAIVHGRDDRLLVIVGPCSIHDTRAAMEYAGHLKAYADQAAEDLLVIMRVYFEKPRTTVGWKGLINDPFLDGSFKINKGLRTARELLLAINELGLPTGYVLWMVSFVISRYLQCSPLLSLWLSLSL